MRSADMSFFDPYQTALEKQQTLTPVESFSLAHDQQLLDEKKKSWQELIPSTRPQEGEQYSFEVDLDKCTGCKACVAACHSLNGLDDKESFRSTGTLLGGTDEDPKIQTITTACHHCLDPGCLNGCPVKAYEKLPETGVVKHLDDQCIGCKYCTWKCPYDVPKYNKDLGIVRKCDMCIDRLEDGQAPACVQSCPQGAIKIKTVKEAAVLADVKSNAFLPGAAHPKHTLPTTHYKSEKPMAENMVSADLYKDKPDEAHPPLTLMLVLTQLAFGTITFSTISTYFGLATNHASTLFLTVMVFLVGNLAMAGATLHLGRPQFLFRAFLGLRTSWFSREAMVISSFIGVIFFYILTLATDYALGEFSSDSFPPLALGLLSFLHTQQNNFAVLAVITGWAGVFCQTMIYADTPRPFWQLHRTLIKFSLTSLSLGLTGFYLFFLVGLCFFSDLSLTDPIENAEAVGDLSFALLLGIGLLTMTKLLFESSFFLHLRDSKHTLLKRSAILMLTQLRNFTTMRFLLGLIGGVIAPFVLSYFASQGQLQVLGMIIATTLILGIMILGELLERHLFFTAVVTDTMPGNYS